MGVSYAEDLLPFVDRNVSLYEFLPYNVNVPVRNPYTYLIQRSPLPPPTCLHLLRPYTPSCLKMARRHHNHTVKTTGRGQPIGRGRGQAVGGRWGAGPTQARGGGRGIDPPQAGGGGRGIPPPQAGGGGQGVEPIEVGGGEQGAEPLQVAGGGQAVGVGPALPGVGPASAVGPAGQAVGPWPGVGALPGPQHGRGTGPGNNPALAPGAPRNPNWGKKKKRPRVVAPRRSLGDVYVLPAALGDKSTAVSVLISAADNRSRVMTSVNRAEKHGSCSRVSCPM